MGEKYFRCLSGRFFLIQSNNGLLTENRIFINKIFTYGECKENINQGTEDIP